MNEINKKCRISALLIVPREVCVFVYFEFLESFRI